jgi:hypothetical protein
MIRFYYANKQLETVKFKQWYVMQYPKTRQSHQYLEEIREYFAHKNELIELIDQKLEEVNGSDYEPDPEGMTEEVAFEMYKKESKKGFFGFLRKMAGV